MAPSTGPRTAVLDPDGNGRSIRTATMPAGGSVTWQLRPGLRTVLHAVVDSTPTDNALVLVRRSVGIGVRQAAGTYVLTGASPPRRPACR